MYSIRFIDRDLPVVDVYGDFDSTEISLLSSISEFISSDFTVLSSDGYILASCFGGCFTLT